MKAMQKQAFLFGATLLGAIVAGPASAGWPPPPGGWCAPYVCTPADGFCCFVSDSGGTGGSGPSEPPGPDGPAGGGCSTCGESALSFGPSSGDPVNLASGVETYQPEADITVYNPTGPSISFQRTFDSSELLHNAPSPDLPDGWYDNYDVRVGYDPDPNGDTMWLEYPNLGVDLFEQVTGQNLYLAPRGKGFYATVGGDGSITVTYADQTSCVFQPSDLGGLYYSLSAIYDRTGHGIHIQRHDHTYTQHKYGMNDTLRNASHLDPNDPNHVLIGRIEYIENDAGTAALVFDHAPTSDTEDPAFGHVVAVTEVLNGTAARQVKYTYFLASYVPPGQSGYPAPSLRTVSQIVAAGATAPVRAQYDYVVNDQINGDGIGSAYLRTITTRNPNTGSLSSTATINYNNGPVGSIVDANGNRHEYTPNQWIFDPASQAYHEGTKVEVFDANNNLVAHWTKMFDRGGYHLPTWRYRGFQDAAGNITSYEYDVTVNAPDPIHPTKITDPDGEYSTYTYDRFGHVLTETNHCGMVTTYAYEYPDAQHPNRFPLGRLMSVSQQNGATGRTMATYTYYEPSGLVYTETRPAPLGSGAATVTTTYTYDSLGNPLTVTAPGNDATGTILTTLNYTSDGAYTQAAAKGEPLTVTVGSGATTEVVHYRYDLFGNRTSVTDALGNQTTTTHNLYNQPYEVTYPATGDTGSGQSKTRNLYIFPGGPVRYVYLYDESGSLARAATGYSYGKEGELLSVTGGGVEPVFYTYDALYHRKTLRDGKLQTTSYSYDQSGRLTHVYYPGYTASPRRDVTDYDYDADGRVHTRTDGNGVVTTYGYTDCSLIHTISYSDATPDVTFTYDDYNRRWTMTDGTGVTTWLYDDQDNVITATTAYTGLSPKTLSYTYWPGGGRKTMTTPSGTFSYAYDAVGRTSSLTNPFSETTSWSYQANGWLSGQMMANGATAVSTYNARGFLKTLNNEQSLGGGQTYSYFDGPSGRMTFDAAGNRLTTRVTGDPGSNAYPGNLTYQYDYKDQLTGETNTRITSANYTHAYDNAGNATTLRSVSGIPYNPDNQRTGPNPPEVYHYDGNGNTDILQGANLTYDAENQLTSYNTSVLTAGYNGDGLRTRKQTSSGKTWFLYDGYDIVCELDNAGNVTATNTFGDNGLISRHTSSGSVFYAFDPQGSVAQRLDASGNVLSSDLYDAYGNKLAGGMTGDPFGYSGQSGYYTDSETGLILCTRRYYDPQDARWLSRDPIGYDGGVNLYGYCENDVPNRIDPSGELSVGRPMRLAVCMAACRITYDVSIAVCARYTTAKAHCKALALAAWTACTAACTAATTPATWSMTACGLWWPASDPGWGYCQDTEWISSKGTKVTCRHCMRYDSKSGMWRVTYSHCK